jgi:cell division septation protein DedD
LATPPPPPDEPVPPLETAVPEPVEPGDAESATCPRCGSPYERGQEYCLECGLRLPVVRGFVAARALPALGRTWRRYVRWYPGDWIWPVVFGLAVAAIGATVAILTTRDHSSASNTIVATGPTGTGPPPTTATTPTGTAPTGTTATGTAPPPPPPPPTPPPPPPGPVNWPPGNTGFTVVLASVVQSDGLPAARRLATRAIGAGLTDVGVLNSSNYSSLNPGYYVVFSGIFDTIAEAEANLSTAKSTFPQAYTRKITP